MKTTMSFKTSFIAALLLIIFSSGVSAENKEKSSFYFSKEVTGDYETIFKKVKAALKGVEFGIVSEMKMHETLNEKANANMDTYVILGICNPKFAHEAIQIEKNIGLMLPCKGIIRKIGENKYVVAFQNPEAIMDVVDNSELKQLTKEVSNRLNEALNAV